MRRCALVSGATSVLIECVVACIRIFISSCCLFFLIYVVLFVSEVSGES